MKKKLFLFLVMVISVCAILAITVCADSTITVTGIDGREITVYLYDDAPIKSKYQSINTEIVEFYDGYACPVSYVFNDVTYVDKCYQKEGDSFSTHMNFEYINSKRASEEGNENFAGYTFANVKGFDIPSGITSVKIYAGRSLTTLEWITFPNTITSLDNAIFQSATGLKKCVLKFSEDNTMRNFPSYMFYGCSSLEAFSMPDCFTKIVSPVTFYNCKAMTALYLSKNLTYWETQGGGTGATFDYCNNMYFVNEPFTYASVPSKPTVYYFPANLTSTDADLDFSAQSAMRHCYELNDVMVFGEKVTKMSNAYFFQNIGSCKIVFLGDMTTVATQNWGKATHVYFANENDLSTDDVTYSGGKTAVFCNAEGNTTHLAEPKKTVSVAETCETNRFETTFCFCGAKIDENKEIPETKLGHDYTVLSSISYADYAKEGTKVHSCSRDNCVSTSESAVAAIIANFSGYSVPTNPQKAGITFRYEINRTALEEYNSINEDLKFGVVGVVEAFANGNKPLTNDCQINSAVTGNVIFADISESNTKVVDFVLLGSAEQWESKQVINGVETNLKDLAIIMAGYIYDGAGVHYIQSKGTMTDLEAVSYATVNSVQ